MNLKQIWAKIKAFALASSLIAAAIVLAGWAYWRYSGALADAHDELDAVTVQNDTMDKNTKASELLEEQLAELKSDAAKLMAGLIDPNPIEDTNNQQYFYNLEHAAGVEQIADPIHTTTERTKDPVEPSRATFTLSVAGHWDSIMSFLYGLESGPHLVRIVQFELVKSQQLRSAGGDPNRLNLTLTLDMLGK